VNPLPHPIVAAAADTAAVNRNDQLPLFTLPPSRRNDPRFLDCGADTLEIGDYYMLHDELWLEANRDDDGMLCFDCVETRLGLRCLGGLHERTNEPQAAVRCQKTRGKVVDCGGVWAAPTKETTGNAMTTASVVPSSAVRRARSLANAAERAAPFAAGHAH
jgi:hypothetical protein